jgi:hypothetical protein
MIAVNYFGSISYLYSQSNDYFFVQTEALAAQVSEHDIVVTDQHWIMESYYKRYLQQPVYSPHDLIDKNSTNNTIAIARFQQDVRTALMRGGAIYLSFRIDSLTTSASVPLRFKDVWISATDNIPLSFRAEQIGDLTFWVTNRIDDVQNSMNK